MPHVRQQRAVHLLHRRPVGAVHVRHVEVVALVAPALVEDLPELRLRIEVHAERHVRAGRCPRRARRRRRRPDTARAARPRRRPPPPAAPACDRRASCRRRSPRSRRHLRRKLTDVPLAQPIAVQRAAARRRHAAALGHRRRFEVEHACRPRRPPAARTARSGTPGTARMRCCRPSKSMRHRARVRRRRAASARSSAPDARRPRRSPAAAGSARPSAGRRGRARTSPGARRTSCRATASAARSRSRRGTTGTCRSRPTPGTSRRPGRRSPAACSPVSTLATKIGAVERVEARGERHPLESGLHDGASVRCGTIHGSRPTTFALPLATSSTQTLQVGVGVEQLRRVGRPRRRVVVRRLRRARSRAAARGRPAPR